MTTSVSTAGCALAAEHTTIQILYKLLTLYIVVLQTPVICNRCENQCQTRIISTIILRCDKQQGLDILSPVCVEHPRVRTDGSFRDGWSCDFFRFAIFPPSPPVLFADRDVVAPPLSVF